MLVLPDKYFERLLPLCTTVLLYHVCIKWRYFGIGREHMWEFIDELRTRTDVEVQLFAG